MKSRVSFASVLKGTTSNQVAGRSRQRPQTLAQYMDCYTNYGADNYDYTICFGTWGAQSKPIGSNDVMDFEDGVNPLESWINSHAFKNRENQDGRRRKVPDNLLKFIPSQNKTQPLANFHRGNQNERKPSKQTKKNMSQLCRMYAEQKDSCNSSYREPVWKFNSKEQSISYQKPSMQPSTQPSVQYTEQYSENPTFPQAKFAQTYEPRYVDQTEQEYQGQEQEYEHNYHQTHPQEIQIQAQYEKPLQEEYKFEEKTVAKYDFAGSREGKMNEDQITEILKKNGSPGEKKNLSSIAQEIKKNLVQDIQTMAEKIVSDRKKTEDQELLISQRSQNQTENDRIQNARKEIGEYLKIKSSSNYKKEDSIRFSPESQQVHPGVGYSFSHDFNKTSHKVQNNQEQMLPNIEEVRSEQDCNENHPRFHEQINGPLNEENKRMLERTDCIKEIQSVAYQKYREDSKFSQQKNIKKSIGQLTLQKYVRSSVSQEDKNQVNERFYQQEKELMDNKTHKLGNREIKVVESRENFLDIKSSLRNEQNKSPDTANKGVDSYLEIQSKINSSECSPKIPQNSSKKKPLPTITQTFQSEPENNPLEEYIKKEDSVFPAKIEFKKVPSPIQQNFVEPQSIQEVKPFCEGPTVEPPKQEEEQKPKRLLKITLSPKFQQKQLKPVEKSLEIPPNTDPFSIENKTLDDPQKESSIKEEQQQKSKHKQQIKENDQHVLNKQDKQDLKVSKGMIQPSSKTDKTQEQKGKSINLNNFLTKPIQASIPPSEREEKKYQPLIRINHGQVKHSIKNSSIKQSNDFQFDLDL